MKLPRDINADKLIKQLKKYGYTVTRQTGSHIRLSACTAKGEHHLTIPNHNPIKMGTLHAIMKDVCAANSINEDEFFL